MKYIVRKAETAIRAHLAKPEITIILGPRQVGKTTLMKKLMAEIRQTGRPVGFYNLDIDTASGLFSTQQHFLDALRLEFAEKPAVVFIDEIQRLQNAGLFLKGLYDRDLPYKFVVSGSGSLELKEKVIESLAGRKRVFHLMPLSFREFFHYKTDYKYKGKWRQAADVYPDLMDRLMKEYLVFGGYPKVVLAEDEKEKRAELQEIILSYLDRDVAAIIGVNHPGAYQRLMRLMAQRTGHFVNYSGLAVLAGLSSPTVKKYLWYLQKTFMINCIPPFFRNPEKEIVKSPACYFTDLGIVNWNRRDFRIFSSEVNTGMIFQNFVFLQLRDMLADSFFELKTWRTKAKAEVDFVIDTGHKPLPVEVKFSDFHKPHIPASLKNFIRSYHPERAYMICKNGDWVTHYLNTEIHIIPYRKLYSIPVNVK